MLVTKFPSHPFPQGCDYVIALTHMRTPNDIRLAENVDEIDLILGGHDHVYEIQKVSNIPISIFLLKNVFNSFKSKRN